MKHSIKPKLFGGILLFALSICLSSCNGTLDDIFGEWDKPSANTNTNTDSTPVVDHSKEYLVYSYSIALDSVYRPLSYF